jgi:hypothetical protein
VAPRAEAALPATEPVAARETFEDTRPSFANDLEPEPRRSGGFSLFGWKKSEPRDEPPSLRDFNIDDDAPAATPRRAHEDVVRDPELDEELEIPAFLRRQMNPR